MSGNVRAEMNTKRTAVSHITLLLLLRAECLILGNKDAQTRYAMSMAFHRFTAGIFR